jgi:hypothetical protein
MEQFYVLGGECKIGDATTPSTCQIPENMYPKLPPKTLPAATKSEFDPDTTKEAMPKIAQCGQDGRPLVSLEEESVVG